MKKPSERVPIDEGNCKRLTTLELHELVELTGYLGLPYETFDVKDTKMFRAYRVRKGAEIWYKNSYFEEILVYVDCDNREWIENASIMGAKKGRRTLPHVPVKKLSNLSMRLLQAQIKAARKFGFKTIELLAFGGNLNWIDKSKKVDRGPKKYNGYIVWGKLGYSMEDEYEVYFPSFLASWQKHISGKQFPNLFKMLKDPAGVKLWKARGGEWFGYFHVDVESPNVKMFKEYLTDKDVKYKL